MDKAARKSVFSFAFQLFTLISLVSCSPSAQTPPPPAVPTQTPKSLVSCADNEVSAFLSELASLLEEWDGTVRIASSTPRVALAPFVRDMQDIKMEVQRMKSPECANYVQDLVLLVMDRALGEFVDFLGNRTDIDTSIAARIRRASSSTDFVSAEIARFARNPLAAWEASTVTTEELLDPLHEAKPFTVPADWRDAGLVDNPELVLTIPNGWLRVGVGGEYTRLTSGDGVLELLVDVLNEPVYAELGAAPARLFTLKTDLDTTDLDFYLVESAKVGAYALNRAYVVEFSHLDSAQGDIVARWAIVATPGGKEVLAKLKITGHDFAEINRLTFATILSSIREQQ